MKHVLAALCLLCIAGAAQAAQHLYAVSVNGHDSKQTLLFDGEGNALSTQADALEGVGLVLPHDTTGDVMLASLGIEAKVDTDTQTVNLVVPAKLLPAQEVGGAAHGVPQLSPRGSAVVVSYDLSAFAGYGTTAWSFAHSIDVPTRWGVFSTAGNLNVGGSTPGYLRTQTSWRYDDMAHLLSYSAGDVLAPSPTGQVPLAGFSLSRNYSALAPQFQSWPSLGLDGLVLDHGTLRVLANKAVVTQKDVQAGPLKISTLPSVGGGVQHLQAVVEDGYGRTVVVADSEAYVSRALLAPGLSTFDFAIGAPRQGVTNRYAGVVATGDYTRGITPWLTLGGAGAIGQDGWSAAVSAAATLGTLGEVHAKVGTSSGGGKMFSAGYSYSDPARGWAVSLQHSQRSNMWQPSISVLPPLARQDSLTASWGRGDWRWHATASRSRFGGNSFDYFEAGTVWHRRNFSFDAGVYGSGQDRGIYADFNISFGRANAGGGVRGSAGYARGSTSGDGWSVSANAVQPAQGSPYESARGMWMTPVGMGVAAVTHSATGATTNLDWRGSVVFGPRPHLTRATSRDDGMVEVVVPGVAGVPVTVNGRPSGRTDSHGRLVAGPISPLVPARVHLDLTHVPMDVVVSHADAQVVAARGGVAKVVFAAQRQTSRVFTLTHAGQPVPLNLLVTAGSEETTTGYDGAVMLSAPKAGETIKIGSLCSATVPSPVPAFDAATTLECR